MPTLSLNRFDRHIIRPRDLCLLRGQIWRSFISANIIHLYCSFLGSAPTVSTDLSPILTEILNGTSSEAPFFTIS
jgi:hypothetical protein